MDASLYLKRQLLAERKIAQSLEKGIRQSFITAGKTRDDIYHGAERLTWYSSCFIDKHHDVCKQLKTEDVRMIKAVLCLYKKKDAMADIFLTYIDYVLRRTDSVEARSLLVSITGFTAEYRTGKVAKELIAYSLVKSIFTSDKFSSSLRGTLTRKIFYGFSAIQFYGKVQKAAMASRRLKSLDPNFYNILYLMDLEMLYIYVEPLLSGIIKKINSLPVITLEEAIKIFQEYQ
ncbi:hypothetical protein COO59_11195 [Mixta theicola]|uniref:Uncharacterized protein n=1 Tax=Mixta theicola TaxID=1458355 RepID=A0A2K1Q961_9GAMM|nr:hypothetical protein [Mixta theicola]PNS11578.1 hypothetical protein COO59_11195 [Mixta theicola]GLR08670.1 hypothetical protein GCM10007905_13890 [Mixta theicola]